MAGVHKAACWVWGWSWEIYSLLNFLRSRYIYTPGLAEDWGAEQTLAKFQFINRVSNGGNISFNENNKYSSAESFLPDGILKNGIENIFYHVKCAVLSTTMPPTLINSKALSK